MLRSLFRFAVVAGLAFAAFFSASPVSAESAPVQVPQGLLDVQNAFRNVAKHVLPSVVEILTTSEIQQSTPQMPTFPNFPNSPEFRYFFGPNFPNFGGPQQPQKEKVEGLGSGVMIKRNGPTVYVLTNNHVVHGAKTIEITLNNGRKYKGKIVGTDPRRDLALVSFDAKNDPGIVLAKLGNSDDVEVGDWVLAIGNPLGLDFTVTHGIVSALGRHGGPNNEDMDSYIQTDAPINRGNSGGALVNLAGEVIGINTWIATPNGANVGLGFAIPINEAKRPIQEFLTNGKVTYGWLGALVSDLTHEAAKALDLGTNKGSFIPSVFDQSPAEKAGIQPGDFVTAINGKKITGTNDLVQTVGNLPVGQKATFTLIRDGKELTKIVTIEARAKESAVAKMRLWPGLDLVMLSSDVRDELNIPKDEHGVAVAHVEPHSTADIAGLKTGDVINKVNGHQVNNLLDFYRRFNADPHNVTLGFLRQGVQLSIGMSR